MREYLLYIDGAWVPQTDGEVMEDRNPADGSVMAMVHMGGRQDAERALAAAYAARGKWAATAPTSGSGCCSGPPMRWRPGPPS